MMKEQLEAIRKGALEAIAGTKAAAELDALRVKYLGKKGELTAVLKLMGSLSAEERPVMGQMANEVRAAVEKAVEAQSAILEKAALETKLKAETLDVTIPGKEVINLSEVICIVKSFCYIRIFSKFKSFLSVFCEA